MGRVKSEIKVIGSRFFLLSGALSMALFVLSVTAGELLSFYPVSFEVIFPFFVTIAVGEWGKTRADSSYDIIAAQSRSLFQWVLLRYAVVFGCASVSAVLCMAGCSVFRYEYPLWELLAVYVPTAFFMSSLCALLGVCCAGEHVAAMICGVVWLAALLLRALLWIPGAEYFYLFIRFADNQNPVWLWNKGILAAMGLLVWGVIYFRAH